MSDLLDVNCKLFQLGKLLEVKVGLGKVETLMRYDRTRQTPSGDHDSVIVSQHNHLIILPCNQ